VTASFFKTLDSVLPPYLGASVWAVGFSGGSDSTALLHLLGQWQRRRSMQSDPNETLPLLQAIHVNHALNAHSSEWQAHCQSNCDDWDVAFTSLEVTVAPQASIEAAARNARYRAFEAALPPGAVLFLAHHLDDQVETFFQRLMRGAGVDGLAAIPASRSLGEATIVRPLLDHPREELSQYVSTQGLSFIEDPSNTDVAIDRNFLRLRVMPLLETRWPAYRRTVARAAQHMASSSDALREHFGLPGTLFNDLGDPGLRLAPLQCDGGAARLRLWLMEQGLQVPDADALDEFIRQLCAAGSESAAKLSLRDYQLARYGDAVYRLPDLDASVRPSYEIAPGQSLIIPGVGSVALEQAETDGWLFEPGVPLSIGWRRGGERVREAGRTGSRDLKAIFQEHRVPPWWRNRVPLLFCEDELLAVAGFATCQSDHWRVHPGAGETLWRLVWRPNQ